MNMISQLRQRVQMNGKAEITPEEFDQLQAEWITRTGAEDMVLAEREACASLADRHEKAHERASETATEEGFRELSVNMSLAAEALASAIRARSNTQPNGANPVE